MSRIALICDRSADGSKFQLMCEECKAPMDWVTGLELAVMAVKGLDHLCMECSEEADMVPGQLLADDGFIPDVYIIVERGQETFRKTEKRKKAPVKGKSSKRK